jgi:glyoxylase-like metal-dependent hydrolase (beta-lactamase superfamily II)
MLQRATWQALCEFFACWMTAKPSLFSTQGFRIPLCKIPKTAADGDELTIGGRIWDLLHVPVHSPGHISLEANYQPNASELKT